MIKCILNRQMLMTILVMLITTLSLSSCETLKKKFTRKPKGGVQSADFQPVLEPEDYPAPEKNPVEIYKQNYAMIKAWYRDLWSGIDEKGSDGSVNYSIKQILDHLEQMKPLLRGNKAQGLDRLSDLLKFYQKSLDQPRQVRNYSRIQSDLRSFDRVLRDDYRFDAVKDDLVGTTGSK